MGSCQPDETAKRCGGRLGKIDAPLNEKLQNVEWGEFRLGDLFEINSYKKRFDANKVSVLSSGKYPYVVRMSSNNGQKGFIEEDEIFLNEGNTISFGQDTATMFYQEKPYFTGDKIKILKAKESRFNKKNAQFFIIAMSKPFSSFSWGSSSFSIKEIGKQIISLPVRDGKIDYEFMENFTAELEAERTAELEAYLNATGLKDYTLTAEEKKAIEDFEKIEFKEFLIGNLFDKIKLGIKNRSFNKKTDLSPVYDSEHTIPVTNAKYGDNGIMFWAKPDDFETASMSIDIVQNGAVATGKVYFQPQETGVLWDSYLIRLQKRKATRTSLLYMTAALEKSIQKKFCYEYKAYWDKVKTESVWLPTKNGQPDYSLMETLISAIQKLVIKDVVLYADRKMAAVRMAVNQ